MIFDIFSISNLAHWVDLARTHPALIILFYFLFVLGVTILPITIFPIIGGVLLDFSFALPLNLLAATAGALVSFLLSRTIGRTYVHSLLKGRWGVFDHVTSEQGFKSVLFLRLMGFPPFIVTNYLLGLSGVRKREFLSATFVGILPWMALVTYGARSLWQAALVGGQKGFRSALVDLLGPISLISVAVLLWTVIGFLLKKRSTRTYNQTPQ